MLAGFERADVVLGQWLLAGEPVGVMSSDESEEHLVVEQREARVAADDRQTGEHDQQRGTSTCPDPQDGSNRSGERPGLGPAALGRH